MLFFTTLCTVLIFMSKIYLNFSQRFPDMSVFFVCHTCFFLYYICFDFHQVWGFYILFFIFCPFLLVIQYRHRCFPPLVIQAFGIFLRISGSLIDFRFPPFIFLSIHSLVLSSGPARRRLPAGPHRLPRAVLEAAVQALLPLRPHEPLFSPDVFAGIRHSRDWSSVIHAVPLGALLRNDFSNFPLI